MRNYRGMSPLTAVVSMVGDRLERPVESLDFDGIQRARARSLPRNPVVDRITGGTDRSVGITYGTAPARDEHEIPLRIYRPRALRDARTDVPVIMWFHGGGWVLGNVLDSDPMCTFLAGAVGCVMVSVDYRMAPEHRAPVAVEDCVDATTWVGVNGDVLRADSSRMAVAGDSAGGTLAAVVAQVLRDHGDPRLRFQALLYPATDMTQSSPSVREHANSAVLTKRSMDAYRDHYLPAGHDLRDPLVSPLFGRLDGLPPALIQTADLDPIRDDGIRYADALKEAGVPVRLTNYLRVPHGFGSMPGASPAVGRQHRWELASELTAALSLGPRG